MGATFLQFVGMWLPCMGPSGSSSRVTRPHWSPASQPGMPRAQVALPAMNPLQVTHRDAHRHRSPILKHPTITDYPDAMCPHFLQTLHSGLLPLREQFFPCPDSPKMAMQTASLNAFPLNLTNPHFPASSSNSNPTGWAKSFSQITHTNEVLDRPSLLLAPLWGLLSNLPPNPTFLSGTLLWSLYPYA